MNNLRRNLVAASPRSWKRGRKDSESRAAEIACDTKRRSSPDRKKGTKQPLTSSAATHAVPYLPFLE
jgi:hypothetical protein